MKRIIISSLLLVELLISCAKAPTTKPQDVQKEFEVNVSYDNAWSAVIETFAEMNLPIKNIEKDSGLITTDWVKFPNDFCDCGSAPMAFEIDKRGKFNVFVKKKGEGVALTVNTAYQVVRQAMGHQFTINCVSTGKLEQMIHENVKLSAQ